eukprot:SAG11_NODE_8734_length_981_cov_1.982993_1_plen_63_part_10
MKGDTLQRTGAIECRLVTEAATHGGATGNMWAHEADSTTTEHWASNVVVLGCTRHSSTPYGAR